MGKASRERRERIEAGLEIPIAVKMKLGASSPKEGIKTCKLCLHSYPDHLCLAHVKECWGMEYTKLEDIPPEPPEEAKVYYYKNHPDKSKVVIMGR